MSGVARMNDMQKAADEKAAEEAAAAQAQRDADAQVLSMTTSRRTAPTASNPKFQP